MRFDDGWLCVASCYRDRQCLEWLAGSHLEKLYGLGNEEATEPTFFVASSFSFEVNWMHVEQF